MAQMNSKNNVFRLATLSILSAMAVLMAGLIQIPIFPGAPYLKYDPADIILILAGFMFGPLWGLAVVGVTAALQEIFFGSSGWIGFLMHFIASGALVVVSSLIFRTKRNWITAVIGVICGAISMTGVMIPLNLIFTPMYTSMPVEAVKDLLIPFIIPFNLIKSGVNSFLAILIFLPLSAIRPDLFKK